MNPRQRQIVLFVGFMFIFTVAMVVLLNSSGVSGPSLGGMVPEGTKEFANDTVNAWGEVADGINQTGELVN